MKFKKWIAIGLILLSTIVYGDSTGYKVDNTGRVWSYDLITKGPWVDVRAFLAVGDSNGTTGNGTDDKTAIQNAFNSLTNGGILYLPGNKIFRVSDTIHYLGSGPLIITGGGTLYFDTAAFTGYDSYTAGLVIEADLTNGTGNMSGTNTLNRTGRIGDRLTIRDVKFLSNGSRTGAFSTAHHCIQLICFDEVTIENCRIEGFNGAAFEQYGTDRVKIIGNTFKNIRQNGVGGAGCGSMLISNNHFVDVGEPVQVNGVYTEICNNIMTGVGGASVTGGAISGIHVGTSSFNELVTCSIHNNLIQLNPTYDAVQSSGIKVANEGSYTTDSYIDYISIKNNTIKGGFTTAIYVGTPPAPNGSIVIAENMIVRSSTVATQNAIKVSYETNGYGGNEWTEIYNNEIIHLDGNDHVSIDVSGAGLTAAPRTKVIGNKITTVATLASEAVSTSLIGGIIYVPFAQPGKCLASNNYKNGSRIEKIYTLANDATPSVLDGNLFLTGGTTTIRNFGDGVEAKIITIIAEHTLTITDGTNIFLSGSTNWTMNATDTLTLIQKADGKWYEISRSDKK